MPPQSQGADAAPIVETDRLILRAHEPHDLTRCALMWAEPAVVRHIGGKPFSTAQAWQKMLVYAGLWKWLGYGYWAVVEKSSGLFVGELGFADFKREIEPPLEGAPELGWALLPQAHGKGYATEGVRGALAWGDAHLRSPRTVCMIDPDNAASIRVAQKCGYRECARTTYKTEPTIVFERQAP